MDIQIPREATIPDTKVVPAFEDMDIPVRFRLFGSLCSMMSCYIFGNSFQVREDVEPFLCAT